MTDLTPSVASPALNSSPGVAVLEPPAAIPPPSVPVALLTDTQRSGSITAIGVILGFSLTLTTQFSTGPGKWDPTGVKLLAGFLAGIVLELTALFSVLRLPPLSAKAHRNAVVRFVFGIALVLLSFFVKVAFDVSNDLKSPSEQSAAAIR